MKPNHSEAFRVEQMKAMLDGIPQDFIAELAEPQMDCSQLVDDTDFQTDSFEVAAPQAQKAEEQTNAFGIAVTAVGGIAAALFAVIGIGVLLRATQPEVGDYSDVSFDESSTFAITTEQNAAGDANGTTQPTAKNVLQASQTTYTDVSESWKASVSTNPTTVMFNENPPIFPVTTYTVPAEAQSEPYAPSALTLEKVEQIIAESCSLQEMYEKIYAIQRPTARWGSGIDYQQFDINLAAQEYIVIRSPEDAIIYYRGTQNRVLYQKDIPDLQKLEQDLNDSITSYLKQLGYNNSEIARIRSAKIDISACRIPQLAKAFVTYSESQHDNPITHDELHFLYSTDTTQYVVWELGHKLINCENTLYQQMTAKVEKEEIDKIGFKGYSGSLTIDFQSGYHWCEPYSICNLLFQTSNIDDIKLERSAGQPHIQYLCDLDGDRFWTYQDLIQMYQMVIHHQYDSALARELIYTETFYNSMPSPKHEEIQLEYFCQVLVGKRTSIF